MPIKQHPHTLLPPAPIPTLAIELQPLTTSPRRPRSSSRRRGSPATTFIMKPVVSALNAWSCIVVSMFAIVILSTIGGMFRVGISALPGYCAKKANACYHYRVIITR